jgi:alkylation response protein AidB-like acyl-CoA dehydrogenase
MDFKPTDEQTMVRDLARGILEKEVDTDRVKAIEAGNSGLDERLWATLADAGLLGIAIDEEHGGMGLGLLELCALLEEIGRVVAPVPVVPSLVLGGMTIAALGIAAQKKRWLTAISSGEALLTAAIGGGDVVAGVVVHREGKSWSLSGRKLLVPIADRAACIIVPASVDGGAAIFLVDPKASGVRIIRNVTSRGESLCDLEFSALKLTDDDLLGGAPQDSSALEAIRNRATVATCALQVGVSDRALEITSAYVRDRQQFGVPIGSFQAVQHRLAEAYIDVQAIRWTMWRAAYRLANNLDATRDVAVAKFWAAEAGARVAASAQHLHGGIGVDIDYPVHRYFLWSKALELSLGSATEQLVRLGRGMAARPPSAGLATSPCANTYAREARATVLRAESWPAPRAPNAPK